MNHRKPIDYSAIFEALDALMAADLPQMDLYCEIGRLVSGRAEKGAAVAAAEYLCSAYSDVSGFSPRNLRRMREFYRAYESAPEVLAEAMTIGWTQNVVILEADLTLRERAEYIRAAGQFGWSKLELQQKIASEAHLEIVLDFQNKVCYTEENNTKVEQKSNDNDTFYLSRQYLQKPNGRVCEEGSGEKAGPERPFHTDSAAISTEEIGNPVYLPAHRELAEHGVSTNRHAARQPGNEDCGRFDLLIGMVECLQQTGQSFRTACRCRYFLIPVPPQHIRPLPDLA